MIEFFKTLLSLSISGTILMLLIFLMKPFIKNKLSKKWQYYIWLVVIIRLLVPYTTEISLINQGFQILISPVTVEREVKPSVPTVGKESDLLDEKMDLNRVGEKTAMEENGMSSTTSIGSIFLMILTVIWLAVALILFIYKIATYYRFCRYIKRESAEVADIESLELLGKVVDDMNIKQTIRLYTNRFVSSPLIIGIFKAKIVLPSLDMTNADYYYTIVHELTHYKRRDMLYKWLVQLAICLHWFNPFVHMISREINHACELSCDEAVIKNLNDEKMRSYGDTLLNAAKVPGNYNNSLAAVTLIENKKLLKERLCFIMNYKKKSRYAVLNMVLLTITLCVGFISLGAYVSEKPEAVAKSKSYTDASDKKDVKKGGLTEALDDKISIDSNSLFSIKSYYKDSYAFLIGWSNDKTKDTFTKTEITTSDQSKMTVYFDTSCKNYAENKAVLSALGKLSEQIEANRNKNWKQNMVPVIIHTLHVGNDLKKIAKEYYQQKDGEWVLAAVLPELDSKLQRQYVKKAYDDNRIYAFAWIYGNLDKEEMKTYASKAYDDKRIDFFAVLYKNLSKEEIKTYASKAYDDNKNEYFAVLSKNLSKEEMKTYASRAYNDKRIDFFAVLSNNLSKEEMKTYASKAYDDKRIDFFAVLSKNLSKEEIKTYARKAYNDGRIDLFTMLSNSLSEEEKK